MAYRVITLSGEVASGKSRLADSLLALLPGWTRLNTGQLFREYCATHGMSIQEVSFLPDEVHRELDRQQLEWIRSTRHTVVEGRLAGWLAREMDDVFRVFCAAPLDVRIRRYMERDRVDVDTARQHVEYRDRLDIEKYRRIYQVDDYRLPAFYQLVLDTATDLPEMLARRVLTAGGLDHTATRNA